MAIEFKLIADPDPTVYKTVRIYQQAYTLGDAVMIDVVADAVDVVPATSSSVPSRMYGVCMETVTTAATTMLVALITSRQTWAADAGSTTSTNDNYQRMVLTNATTVNNSHSDSTNAAAVFQQLGVLSTTRIVGRFIAQASV